MLGQVQVPLRVPGSLDASKVIIPLGLKSTEGLQIGGDKVAWTLRAVGKRVGPRGL